VVGKKAFETPTPPPHTFLPDFLDKRHIPWHSTPAAGFEPDLKLATVLKKPGLSSLMQSSFQL
jgi:hypothetical protein